MNEEDITHEELSGDAQLTSRDSEGAVETVASRESDTPKMTLEELNDYLGKNFKDKETALKSLKDTYSYVGKKKEDIAAEVLSKVQTDGQVDTLAKELEEMRKERFFDKNPQYAEPSIRKLIDSLGGSPSEVVNREEFKSVFDKVSSYEESAKLKTVLEGNSRLAESRTSLEKAVELKKSGANADAYEAVIAKAVLDSME
jgi:hypothetical protein